MSHIVMNFSCRTLASGDVAAVARGLVSAVAFQVEVVDGYLLDGARARTTV